MYTPPQERVRRMYSMKLVSVLVPFFVFAIPAWGDPTPQDPPPSVVEDQGVDTEEEEELSLFDALTGGKVSLDNRIRYEYANTTGRQSSAAVTNRIRLGYRTQRISGFQAFIEMENVSTFDESNYFVPATGDGSPSRTVIADPTGTEVNQAYLNYKADGVGESGYSVDLKLGRQRIILDDSRFVGNVGWRQFEQTFDAVSAEIATEDRSLAFKYAYIWRIQRIFGPDGPNFDSSSHLFNGTVKLGTNHTLTPFAYLLDFQGDSPRNSVNTYGGRLKGDFGWGSNSDSALRVTYEGTIAFQHDTADNTRDYEALFGAFELGLRNADRGSIAIGFQHLGSDDGVAAFVFPLGTNHKFQGFADQFLSTPDTGLQDLYITGTLNDLLGFKASLTLHQFWSDEGSMDLGHELDFNLVRKLTDHVVLQIKGAFFSGQNGQPDTTRVWTLVTVKF